MFRTLSLSRFCIAVGLLAAMISAAGPLLAAGVPGPVNGCRFQNLSTYNTWSRNQGLLGKPIKHEQPSTRSSTGASGTFMLCERGTIMRIASGRYAGLTCVVRGGIGEKYSAFGGPAGVLGFPINDERNINSAGHDQQLFERGFIVWRDAIGDFSVQLY